MAKFSDSSKLSFTFKKAKSKAFSDLAKAFYEEAEGGGFLIDGSDVYVAPIADNDPATAIAAGVAQDRTGASALQLTNDITVSASRGWQARTTPGDIASALLENWIPPRYGISYASRLYQDDGTGLAPGDEIVSSDVNAWIFDEKTGILTFQEDITGTYTEPLWIQGYRYIGSTATDTSTFLGLTDTPATYAGQAGLFTRVNVGETEIEFVAGPFTTFLAMTDTPAAFAGAAGTICRVNGGETALQFYSYEFLALPDTPSTYTGQALKGVRVNTGATALEFYDRTFLNLTDTPSTYVAQANRIPVVNVGVTALEFIGQFGRTYYVDYASAAGGDGSVIRPFRTIPDANTATGGSASEIIIRMHAGVSLGSISLLPGMVYRFVGGVVFDDIITLSGTGVYTVIGESALFTCSTLPMFTVGVGQELIIRNFRITGSGSESIFSLTDTTSKVEAYNFHVNHASGRLISITNGSFWSDENCKFTTGDSIAVRIAGTGDVFLKGTIENNSAGNQTISILGGTIYLDAHVTNLGSNSSVITQALFASTLHMAPTCRIIAQDSIAILITTGIAHLDGYIENNSASRDTIQVGGSVSVSYVDIMPSCFIYNQGVGNQLLISDKGPSVRMHAGCRLDGNVVGTTSIDKDNANSALYIVPCAIKLITITGTTNILPGPGAMYTYGVGDPSGVLVGVPCQVYINTATGNKYLNTGPIGGTTWMIIT